MATTYIPYTICIYYRYGLCEFLLRVNTVKPYDAWKIWAKYLKTMIPKQKSVWTQKKCVSCKKLVERVWVCATSTPCTGWKRTYPTWNMWCSSHADYTNIYFGEQTKKNVCASISYQIVTFFRRFFWFQLHQSDLQMKCLRCNFKKMHSIKPPNVRTDNKPQPKRWWWRWRRRRLWSRRHSDGFVRVSDGDETWKNKLDLVLRVLISLSSRGQAIAIELIWAMLNKRRHLCIAHLPQNLDMDVDVNDPQKFIDGAPFFALISMNWCTFSTTFSSRCECVRVKCG